MEKARTAWCQAMTEALSQAGMSRQDISQSCFCLAGADLPEDYALLNQAIDEIAHPMKVFVKNDSIAALRAGLHDNSFGVAVVVGAGFNAAGRGKDGQEIILPGLGYISGDFGGGRWIGHQIIRAIIRAWDGRGPATALRQAVFESMGVKDELELIRFLRQNSHQNQILDLVPVLFDVAYEGDPVAESLLTFLGTEVGVTAGTLIRRLALEDEEVPVILSTSVFRGKGPLLINVITDTIHRIAPKAHIVMPDFIPVVGAALEALAARGLPFHPGMLSNLRYELIANYPELIRNDLPTLA
jgi:N-acetylglucosamine kinase-like BadF-type ATPase